MFVFHVGSVGKAFGKKGMLEYLVHCMPTRRRHDFLIRKSNGLFDTVLGKYEKMSSPTGDVPKTIYLLWMQGYENAPRLVKLCRKSVEHFFGDEYEIKVIDKDNLFDFIPSDNIAYRRFLEGKITIQHFSDYLRMYVLNRFGGYWMDSTLFFPKRFELDGFVSEDGFGSINNVNSKKFSSPSLCTCTWAMFFMASKKDSLVSKAFLDCYDFYLSDHEYLYSYYMSDLILAAISMHGIENDSIKHIPYTEADLYVARKSGLKDFSRNISKMDVFQKMNWRRRIGDREIEEVERYLENA